MNSRFKMHTLIIKPQGLSQFVCPTMTFGFFSQKGNSSLHLIYTYSNRKNAFAKGLLQSYLRELSGDDPSARTPRGAGPT
jgi:hypothetical protein